MSAFLEVAVYALPRLAIAVGLVFILGGLFFLVFRKLNRIERLLREGRTADVAETSPGDGPFLLRLGLAYVALVILLSASFGAYGAIQESQLIKFEESVEVPLGP